jgi:uncharacterized alpha-E superfamily protein
VDPRAGTGVSTDQRALRLLLDPDVTGSLVATLGLLVNSAHAVREQLSGDTWQLISDIDEEVTRTRAQPPTQLVALQARLSAVLQSLTAMAGVWAENMERDPVWHFLDAGRRLERAQTSVRLIRTVLVRRRSAVVEDLLLESLLEAFDSVIVFRRRSGSVVHAAAAVDLLIYDTRNPRSVLFQLERLVEHVAGLPSHSGAFSRNEVDRLLDETITVLREVDPDRLASVDADGSHRTDLETVLRQVEGLLGDLLDRLRATYFTQARLTVLSGRTTGGGR